MACILHIETSTNICSVALSRDGVLLFDRVHSEGPSHAVVLAPFVQEAMEYLSDRAFDIDAVAVSCGPGSYTGLRIGVSMAKGICFAKGIPLIAIGTTAVMAYGVVRSHSCSEDVFFCPMIDARRMEVYATLYNANMEMVRTTLADVVDENTYLPFLQRGKVFFFGNGAMKCRDIIKHPNAVFLEGVSPLASGMIDLAERAWRNKQFENTAYFEPFYLKEFIATQSKNKVLTLQ